MSYEFRKAIWKTLKGAMLAGAGAGATYFLHEVGAMDWGASSVVVAGLVSVVINGINQFVKVQH